MMARKKCKIVSILSSLRAIVNSWYYQSYVICSLWFIQLMCVLFLLSIVMLMDNIYSYITSTSSISWYTIRIAIIIIIAYIRIHYHYRLETPLLWSPFVTIIQRWLINCWIREPISRLRIRYENDGWYLSFICI